MSMVGDQDVLRFQIPMVDPDGMAILDSIQNLKKSMFGQLVVTHKVALFSNVGEKVAFRAEFNDDKRAIWAVEYADQGYHVGMLTSLMMKSYLSSLETMLSGIQSMFRKCLYSIGNVSVDVDGLVNNAVGSNTKDRDKFKSIGQDTSKSVLWRKTSRWNLR